MKRSSFTVFTCIAMVVALTLVSRVARSAPDDQKKSPAAHQFELLQRLDWVIASVHTSFGMDEKAMTDRMVTAIEHPWVFREIRARLDTGKDAPGPLAK